MIRLLKQLLKQIFQSVVFWSFAFCAFIFIRYFALNEEEGIEISPELEVPITSWLEFGFILGLVIGLVYAISEFIFENYITQKLNLGVSILLKTVTYFLMLIISLSLLTVLIEDSMDVDLPNERGWWMRSHWFWMASVYFAVCSVIYTLLRIAVERFGRGMFLKILLGTYRSPKEEKRIFMFLDLKSSTQMAEELGHFKYSQLIQDCFIDLNAIINRDDAEIYQYVGDEAVLSWKFDSGVKNNRCVRIYYDYLARLDKKQSYYKEKYGLLPKFKAGMHGGTLMAAEVGTIKKEMAYHGDVINTTARIQGECNKYKAQFLISAQLLNALNLGSKYRTEAIGEIPLKGKSEAVGICAITLAS